MSRFGKGVQVLKAKRQGPSSSATCGCEISGLIGVFVYGHDFAFAHMLGPRAGGIRPRFRTAGYILVSSLTFPKS